MPPLPPTKYVLEALQNDVLPAAGGGALVLCVFLLLGRWSGALGSATAVAVAFLWANFTLTNLRLEEKPTWENTARLIPWKPAEGAPGWHHLPRAALLLVVVGLVSRWAGLIANRALAAKYWWGANLVVWAPRVAAVVFVSGWLASGRAATAPEWQLLRYQLVGSMVLVWLALDGVARSDGGLDGGADAAAYQALIFLVAGTILLYTHNARLMEVAVVLGFAAFGVAVVATLGGCDTSGAVPAGAVFLPGLLLATRPSLTPHNVPPTAVWLVALAPLVLLPFLLPALVRKNNLALRLLRAALIIAPLVAAVVLASEHEKLSFEEEW
jgi:hypothetical protein